MDDRDQAALDALYRDIFETDKRGAVLFEDLCRHFAKGPARGFDQSAMNQTFARAHQRAVIDYILQRINRANGVNEGAPTDE